MKSLLHSLSRHAVEQPDSIALIDAQGQISFGELDMSVNTLARQLIASGISRGDRVALIASKRIDTVKLLLAVMRLEGIAVPVNPSLKAAQITHILNDSEAIAFFHPERNTFTGELDQQTSDRLLIKTSIENRESALAPLPDNASLPLPSLSARAAILYTSGSTGNPKGVLLTHANLAYGAASVSSYLNNQPADRILALMPLSFDYGLSQVTTAIYSGACAVLFNYFVPKGVIDAVQRYSITGLPGVPHVWDQLCRLTWPSVEHLRYITNTGGGMNPATTSLLSKKLENTQIYLMYGFTEAFRSTWLHPEQVPHRPSSIGKPVPFADVRVVRPDGSETCAEETGELIHGGPLVSAGYWNDEAQSKEKFRPRYENSPSSESLYAWSGDLVRRCADGYLYFVSRRDDQLKLNGFRVNPIEIEQTIRAFESVLEAGVISVPHPVFGSALLAIVTASSDIRLERLSAFIARELPSYMAPRKVLVIEKMPLNPNNKIDRNRLKSVYQDTFAETPTNSAPGS